MGLNLQRQDYLFILGGAAAVLALAFGGMYAGVSPMVELPLDVVTMLVALTGVYFIYKAAGTYGGNIGRYLSIIGIGLAYYALTFIPHTQIHIAEMEMGMASIGPVDNLALYLFQHVAVFWVFLLVAYGFYLFWQGGGE